MNYFYKLQAGCAVWGDDGFKPENCSAPLRCPACLSSLNRMNLPILQTYCRCSGCGLMVDLSRFGSKSAERMVRHYTQVDPHEEVGASKSGFYRKALEELDVRVHRRPRRLLDLGCGHGHFLEMAAAFRWKVLGVDIVPEAVCAARKRVPDGNVFQGDLRQAGLESDSLEAITLWDALDQVEDPAAELEECFRILCPGGTIAIRVRNGASQLWIYRFFRRSIWLWRMAGVKTPYTFHRYSFTQRAIEQLLVAKGFVGISIRNSPLTQGDPYRYMASRVTLGMVKRFIGVLAEIVDRLSRGRCLIAPSLLVWARKPL
jgi:ubiquinone/menaquinone biosynthesis C-methylase UbiE